MASGPETDDEYMFGNNTTDGEDEFWDNGEFGETEEDEGEEEEEGEEVERLPEVIESEPELLPAKSYRVKRNNLLDFHNVQDLVNFLSKIKLVWPEDLPYYNEEEFHADPRHIKFPPPFYQCTQKEKAVLWHAENFRKQFLYKFENRRQPYIAPKNECDCQKLFPTFIQPATLGYVEFYDPEPCVQYFKDYLSPVIVEPVVDLPTRIRSHAVVLKERLANSYEHSIIVVSLLIGAGYDAYVVDGYASKEVTTMCGTADYVDDFQEKEDYFNDEFTSAFTSGQKQIEGFDKETDDEDKDDKQGESEHARQSIVLDPFDEERAEADNVRPVSPSKYRLKLKKRFQSKYVAEMEDRAEKKLEEEKRLQKEKEYDEWLKSQRPPTPDPLQGYRSHAWVLVLPRLRPPPSKNTPKEDEETLEEFEEEPQVPFFLEVFSGTKLDVSDSNFHGIEAVFNQTNYWINIQEPKANCGELNYDLENSSCWAQLLFKPKLKKKVIEDTEQKFSSFNEEEEEEVEIPEMFIDMPISWTTDFQISEEDYKKKYPAGKKTFEYNDAIVDVAAPFVNEDGLIRRVIKFNGKSRQAKNLVHIEERFDKRKDKMKRRMWYKRGRIVHEYFEKGRKDSLKEHIHVSGRNKAHYPRHLYYYSNAHPECVYHRQVVHKGLVEHFEHREDFLYYRFTAFGGVLCRTLQPKDVKSRTKVFVEFLKGDTGRKRPRRKIIGIIEKFHRNPKKAADDDISEKHMLIEEGKFRILFHYGDENYTRRTLEFFKTAKGFKKETVDFKPEDCIEFRVDPFGAKTTTYKKYIILKQLQRDQITSIDKAREAEDEVYHTVTNRVQEDWKNELELDYSSQSREEEKARMKELDDEEEQLDLGTIDFASPYLELMTPKNKEEEVALKQFILQNAKDRIMRQAEHISQTYQEASAKLKELLRNPPNLKDEIEAQRQGFSTHFDRVLCRMHIMEQRILRLREKAPGKYTNLLIQVIQHPLLNKYTEAEKLERQRRLLESLRKPPAAEDKKHERVSCCRLDYIFKHPEKKKKGGETTTTPAPVPMPESGDQPPSDEQPKGIEAVVGNVIRISAPPPATEVQQEIIEQTEVKTEAQK